MTSATAAALLVGLALALPARADTVTPACVAPLDLIRLANPLPRVAQKVASGQPVTIVAIGSSSTSGAGASSPAANYPSRLAIELKQHFPKLSIHRAQPRRRRRGSRRHAQPLRFRCSCGKTGSRAVAARDELSHPRPQARRSRCTDPRRSRKNPRHRRRYRADRSAVRAKGHLKARCRAHGHADFGDRKARRCRSLPPLRCHAALARRRSDRLRDVCFARRAPHE